MKRISAAIISATIFMSIVGCTPPLPTQSIGTIRCNAEEEFIGMPLTTYPVPNVYFFGTNQGAVDPNAANILSGVTGSLGYADTPGIAVNTTWSIDFNFSFAIPQCGSKSQAGYVPSQGATFKEICIL